jgi:hypothetical protein
VNQLLRIPLTFDISGEGKVLWENWYAGLPASEHVRRLDTIGSRDYYP